MTLETRSSATTRASEGVSGRVTLRDVAMLRSISTARYLTVEALEWLHVPGWNVRWRRHQEAGGTQPYYPQANLYKRLVLLEHHDLIGRLVRNTQIGVSMVQRLADVFYLTEAGAHLLSRSTAVPMEGLSYFRKRPRSFITLNHSALIGQTYAALRAKIDSRLDVTMTDWQGDHISAKDFDRVTVPQRDEAGQLVQVVVGIQPDATFALHHPGGTERVLVEVDRDTRSLRTWMAKIQAYTRYAGSAALRERYGVESFVLLTVTTSTTQQQALMEATAGVLGEGSNRYLFALDTAIHPLTVGQSWTKITSVRPSKIPYRPTITTDPHVFLR